MKGEEEGPIKNMKTGAVKYCNLHNTLTTLDREKKMVTNKGLLKINGIDGKTL